MASITLAQLNDDFPNGTSVGAYKASNWLQHELPPSGAAKGSADNSQTVTAGAVTFTGLTEGIRYYAAAEVAGTWRYVGFFVDTQNPADLLTYDSATDTLDIAAANVTADGEAIGGGGGVSPVLLTRVTLVAGDFAPTNSGGYKIPTDDGWLNDGTPSIAGGDALFPGVCDLRAADLAVPGKTTKLRTRLSVRPNAVAPGMELRARLRDATLAGASGALTMTVGTERDSVSIAAAGASVLTTAVSAGVALPADGLLMLVLWQGSAAAAGSRYLVDMKLEAYYEDA